MSDNLDTLSDVELNELFAVEVVNPARAAIGNTPLDMTENIPPFTTDANAVLPWLEKQPLDKTIRTASIPEIGRVGWLVNIRFKAATQNAPDQCEGQASTFARAACIALIRAKRSAP